WRRRCWDEPRRPCHRGPTQNSCFSPRRKMQPSDSAGEATIPSPMAFFASTLKSGPARSTVTVPLTPAKYSLPAPATGDACTLTVEGCVPALRREQVPERDPAARRVDLRVANKETGFTLEEPVAPRDGAVDCVLDDRGRAPEGRPARVVERRVPL